MKKLNEDLNAISIKKQIAISQLNDRITVRESDMKWNDEQISAFDILHQIKLVKMKKMVLKIQNICYNKSRTYVLYNTKGVSV